ncbi:MAG: 2-C-methyl-D-erythritol 4-phosphate cytidylyltransferase [Veillonella sp.]|uniref:2-C-methyl-D-erythritol 4-phosphate cytidylyltransferase n=1 Tax=Veillonella sp. TaxID=1926307 RepID=UPI0029034F79|nr:2-C-methyl-D-erythritol 4-phosphate cytidylyltransferase [Veillonella sp.]MDU2710306.1 2-C-methyl-D-erythritol 4-phosphate cytidylyltransferase [Veillonella sp.]
MDKAISCIVLAAGAGRRMAYKENKIFIPLGRYSIIQRTLQNVAKLEGLKEIILVVADGEQDYMAEHIKVLELTVPIQIVLGGAERQDSVACGLKAFDESTDIVLVHDGARPLASTEMFSAVAEAANIYGAATVGVPATDTIKRVDAEHAVIETLKRSELYQIQTPQGFQKELFTEAHEKAHDSNYLGTDDVSLVEYLGKPVHIVEGDYCNIKVTTPNDIAVAKRYLGIEDKRMRVGFGYDIHQLKAGRPCILGGVRIESELGPDGHSDADVLIHALMDAMLGAAGLRDIGYYFPPEDDQYKGISSMLLLEKVNSLLKERGLQAYNIDIMVISETPKLKPYIDMMKANLQSILEIPLDRISIKATTNEMLGAIGRREGIAAQAVVSVYEGEV